MSKIYGRKKKPLQQNGWDIRKRESPIFRKIVWSLDLPEISYKKMLLSRRSSLQHKLGLKDTITLLTDQRMKKLTAELSNRWGNEATQRYTKYSQPMESAWQAKRPTILKIFKNLIQIMKISTVKLRGTKTNGGMEQKQSAERNFSVLTGYSIIFCERNPWTSYVTVTWLWWEIRYW